MDTKRHTVERLRRLTAGSAAVGLLGVLLLVPTGAAAQEEGSAPAENPAPNLGGYVTEGNGAPLSVLLFEPVTPVPADPGEPHLRADHAYVLTNLTTGPSGRALASSLWPGPLVGDGFNLITGAGDYPFKTDVQSPGQMPSAELEAPGGAGMRSVAEGFMTRAIAQAGESPAGEQLAFGNFDGESFSRLEEGRAVTTTLVTAQDVNLLAGMITIDSVETEVVSSSDGVTAATAGRTTVSGLVIAGRGYQVDEQGIRPVGSGPVAEAPENPAAQELKDNLGIEVAFVDQVEVLEGPSGIREAGGLEIRVDLGVLRAQVDTGPVEEVLQGLPDIPDPGLPPEVTGQLPVNPFGSPYLTLLPAFLASPDVVFVLGRAESETAATEPLTIEPLAPLPPPPPPPPPAGPATEPTATTSTPPTSGGTTARPSSGSPLRTSSTTLPSSSSSAVSTAPPPMPSVAAPLSTSTLLPSAPVAGIVDATGVPALLALLGLLGALAGSRALRGLAAGALGTAGACATGRPTDLPALERTP